MKGLLYKDFHAFWRMAFVSLALSAGVLVFYIFFVPKSLLALFLLSVPAMFISFSIMMLAPTEYNTRWSMFVGTLPLSRAKIVFEKYLFNLIISSGATMFYCIVLALYKLIYNKPYHIGNFSDLTAPVLFFAIIMIHSCLNQISSFCLEPIKASILNLVFTFLVNIIFYVMFIIYNTVMWAFSKTGSLVFSVFALCVALAVWGLSFGISYLGYRKKDLV